MIQYMDCFQDGVASSTLYDTAATRVEDRIGAQAAPKKGERSVVRKMRMKLGCE